MTEKNKHDDSFNVKKIETSWMSRKKKLLVTRNEEGKKPNLPYLLPGVLHAQGMFHVVFFHSIQKKKITSRQVGKRTFFCGSP